VGLITVGAEVDKKAKRAAVSTLAVVAVVLTSERPVVPLNTELSENVLFEQIALVALEVSENPVPVEPLGRMAEL
jgi:hypothetical protein